MWKNIFALFLFLAVDAVAAKPNGQSAESDADDHEEELALSLHRANNEKFFELDSRLSDLHLPASQTAQNIMISPAPRMVINIDVLDRESTAFENAQIPAPNTATE